MARTATKTAPTKTVDGVAYPRECWAYAPSADPSEWYLRLYADPEDKYPDGGLIYGCVETLKRASISRAQSRLKSEHVPVAMGKVKAAWLQAFPTRDIPDVLKDAVDEPAETASEKE